MQQDLPRLLRGGPATSLRMLGLAWTRSCKGVQSLRARRCFAASFLPPWASPGVCVRESVCVSECVRERKRGGGESEGETGRKAERERARRESETGTRKSANQSPASRTLAKSCSCSVFVPWCKSARRPSSTALAAHHPQSARAHRLRAGTRRVQERERTVARTPATAASRNAAEGAERSLEETNLTKINH